MTSCLHSRQREERAKQVAEKQAVLAREEQERRKRMDGQRKKDELFKKEKFHQKKVKEFEQKTEKQKVGTTSLYVYFEFTWCIMVTTTSKGMLHAPSERSLIPRLSHLLKNTLLNAQNGSLGMRLIRAHSLPE